MTPSAGHSTQAVVNDRNGGRAIIGLVSPYFALFDAAMPQDLRSDRSAYAERIETLLTELGQVLSVGLVDSEEAGHRAGLALSEAGCDVVVCAPSMAAPPSYTATILEELPDVPVLVLGVQEEARVPDKYTTEEATRRSLPVGIVMLTNVLVRQGRAFTTVMGSWADGGLADRISTAVRGAVAASSVRGARLMALGTPIDGYTDVEVTDQDLALLGVTSVSVSADDLAAAFDSVDTERIDAEIANLRNHFESSAVSDPVLARSVRLTCALRDLCIDVEAVGGTVNCHSSVLRWNDHVGVTACLGVSMLTSEGTPLSCTGDLPTAVALVLGRTLAGSALYCELYQLDIDRDWILIANGGEGDLAARTPDGSVTLLPEDHYSGAHGAGTAVSFPLPEGAGTLISLSPVRGAVGGWRLVVAEGSIIGSDHATMEGPNGMFRFDAGGVTGAYERWCELGATHHAAFLAGHHLGSLEIACRYLGIECARV